MSTMALTQCYTFEFRGLDKEQTWAQLGSIFQGEFSHQPQFDLHLYDSNVKKITLHRDGNMLVLQHVLTTSKIEALF